MFLTPVPRFFHVKVRFERHLDQRFEARGKRGRQDGEYVGLERVIERCKDLMAKPEEYARSETKFHGKPIHLLLTGHPRRVPLRQSKHEVRHSSRI